MDFDDNFKKTHRAPKAGRKADKKKESNLKKKGIDGEKKKRVSTAESNPKVNINTDKSLPLNERQLDIRTSVGSDRLTCKK